MERCANTEALGSYERMIERQEKMEEYFRSEIEDSMAVISNEIDEIYELADEHWKRDIVDEMISEMI